MNRAPSTRPRLAPESVKKPSCEIANKRVLKKVEEKASAEPAKAEAPVPKSVGRIFREELAGNFFTMADLANSTGVENFEWEAEQLFYEAAYIRDSAENEVATYYRFLLSGMVVKTGEKTFALFCPFEKLWRDEVSELSLRHFTLSCFNSVVAPWVNKKIDTLESHIIFEKTKQIENNPVLEQYKEEVKNLKRFIKINNSKMKIIVENLAAKFPFDPQFSSKLNNKSSLIFPVLGGRKCVIDKEKNTLLSETMKMTPDDLFSKRWNVDMSLTPDMKAIEDFMASILWRGGKAPDSKDLKYFVKLLAISLCGFAPQEKIIVFITGGANNGKSTLCNLIEKMLGNDFTSCSDGLLTRCKADDTQVLEKSLNMLVGKRIAVLSEPGAQVVFQSSTIKRLTGDDSVVVKKLYENQRSAKLDSAIWVLSNQRPSFDNVDQALLNRIRHVHFAATFVSPGSEDPEKDLLPRDPRLIERVMSPEGVTAFFHWIMRGLECYLDEGLGDNDRFDADTGQLVAAEAAPLVEPSIYRFVNECCEQDGEYLEKASSLYSAYVSFCKEQNFSVKNTKSQTAFGTQMSKMMGFQKKDMRHGSGQNKVSTYLGIRLLKVAPPSAE